MEKRMLRGRVDEATGRAWDRWLLDQGVTLAAALEAIGREIAAGRPPSARVARLARQIDADYPPGTDHVVIGVLKGGVYFCTDLTKRLKTPLRVDFFQTSSYGSGKTAGEIRIKRDIDLAIPSVAHHLSRRGSSMSSSGRMRLLPPL